MTRQKIIKILGVSLVFCGVSTALLFANEYRKNSRPAVATDFIMDTFVEQKLYGENASEAIQEIAARLRDFEGAFSMHLADSEIDRLNQSAGVGPVVLSKQVYELLKRSKELSLASEGAFDVTIAPLTTVWGITSETPSIPLEEEIAEAMALVDANDLILYENGLAELSREGQAVDLGGIAKGAACDIVRQVTEKYDITSGYVSIGGNIVALQKKPLGSDLWFGVRDPQEGASDSVCALKLYGKTMATTGGYERYFEQDGVTYHHVLDPQTGWPADSDLLSVSVICEDGTLADYLSTTLFVLGKETVLDCLDRRDFQLIAIGEDGNIYCSTSLKGDIQENPGADYNFVYGERQ